MKQTSLKTQIAKIDECREAFITPNSVLTYKHLVAGCWHGADTAAVVIFCADLADTLRAMVALDGAVDVICAMPSNLAVKDIEVLLAQWPFDTVITDADGEMRNVFVDHGLTCVTIDQAIDQAIDWAIEPSTVSAARQDVPTRWLVPTSGTSSTPKLVVHTLTSLGRTALENAQNIGTPQIWALFYDITRFAGYQVLFQSLISGHTLVFAGLDTPIEERVSFYAKHKVTHISATPTLWRKILMSPSSSKLAPAQITLGGEAADQAILTALEAKYPQARVTHIYASTEAGVGLAVSDGRVGFPLSYTEKAFRGGEVRLSDNRLSIRAARNPDGYAGGAKIADSDGWIDTGDLVKIDGDRFFIIGRESGIINVGGDKVVPEQVRDALLECDIVQEAVVYGKKSPFTGALVVADVVLAEPMADGDARDAIDAFLSTRLTPQQRPRVFRFVSEIQASTTGKVISKS